MPTTAGNQPNRALLLEPPAELKPIQPSPPKRVALLTASDTQTLLVEPCAEGEDPERPPTGWQIEADEGVSGRSTLDITNGLSLDAAVRLVEASGSRTSRFVYIRAREAYTLDGIEPGLYWLRFASGSSWISACAHFQADEDIDEFEKPFTFRQEVTRQGEYEVETWTEGAVSLHPVPEGTARTRKIDRRRF